MSLNDSFKYVMDNVHEICDQAKAGNPTAKAVAQFFLLASDTHDPNCIINHHLYFTTWVDRYVQQKREGKLWPINQSKNSSSNEPSLPSPTSQNPPSIH